MAYHTQADMINAKSNSSRSLGAGAYEVYTRTGGMLSCKYVSWSRHAGMFTPGSLACTHTANMFSCACNHASIITVIDATTCTYMQACVQAGQQSSICNIWKHACSNACMHDCMHLIMHQLVGTVFAGHREVWLWQTMRCVALFSFTCFLLRD